MALEYINLGTRYCWYDAAYGKLDEIIPTTYNDFGYGNENTAYVMNKFDLATAGGWGAQNDNETYDDMWGVKALTDKVEDGWFVASKSEWAAFGDMVTKKLGVTTSTYDYYGLKSWYWSSSKSTVNSVYNARFNYGYIRNSDVNETYMCD